MAVAMLTTMNVAIARQTASDSVNFQMASMQRTVQATSDTVITKNAIQRTSVGLTTPFVRDFNSTTTSVLSPRSAIRRIIANALLRLSLPCDGVGRRLDRLRVAQIVAANGL